MDLIFLPFQIFILFPPFAFLAALIFLFLFLGVRKNVKPSKYLLLLTVFLWVIYGTWEIKVFYWSKTVITPIRMDLLIIVPILYIASIAAVLSPDLCPTRAARNCLLILLPAGAA